MARAALRDDLHAVHAQLTAQVLAAGRGPRRGTARELVTGWEKANAAVPESVRLLRSITGSRTDLARASVGLRGAGRAALTCVPSVALHRAGDA